MIDAAAPARPAIISVAVSPSGTLPASGRAIVISAVVRRARRCTFLAERAVGGPLGAIRTVSCASGHASATLPAVSNTTTGSIRLMWAIRAVSPQATVVRHGSFSEAAPPAVVGPADAAYPTYGNPAPTTLGSAAFAAAADWERIVVGVRPDETGVAQQFAAAGGTDAGLTVDQLFAYWQGHGITGLELMARQPIALARASVESAVRSRRALIASLRFTDGTQFGPYAPAPGEHPVVVDGFTPTGPLVVTWGETFQIAWSQWASLADGLWVIGVGVP